MTHRGPFQPRTFCDSVILSVPDPAVYLLHSTHFIYLNIGSLEAATNPAAIYKMSTDRGTGLLVVLPIPRQAVEIHPIIADLILLSTPKTAKLPLA